jgi:hypothetical protein
LAGAATATHGSQFCFGTATTLITTTKDQHV